MKSAFQPKIQTIAILLGMAICFTACGEESAIDGADTLALGSGPELQGRYILTELNGTTVAYQNTVTVLLNSEEQCDGFLEVQSENLKVIRVESSTPSGCFGSLPIGALQNLETVRDILEAGPSIVKDSNDALIIEGAVFEKEVF